jgi:hypothetical protein
MMRFLKSSYIQKSKFRNQYTINEFPLEPEMSPTVVDPNSSASAPLNSGTFPRTAFGSAAGVNDGDERPARGVGDPEGDTRGGGWGVEGPRYGDGVRRI